MYYILQDWYELENEQEGYSLPHYSFYPHTSIKEAERLC